MYGGGRVIEYRVQNPSGRDVAFIADFGPRQHSIWKTLLVRDGADWTGNYAIADEAFAALFL